MAINNNASASSSASGGGGGGGGGSSGGDDVGTKEMSTVPGDSCTWYARGECYSPRSCFDCLNVLLASDTCGINLATGACESLSTMPTGADGPEYSSQSATYCSPGDSVCDDCNTAWIDAYLHSNDPPANDAACVGTGGCVCLAVCTQPTRESLISDEFCALFGTSLTRTLVFGGIGLAVCLCFALLAVSTRWVLNRCAPESLTLPPASVQRERRLRARRLPRREPSGPQLSLEGWKAMREQLIQSELASLSVPGNKGAHVAGDGDDDSSGSNNGGGDNDDRGLERQADRLALNTTAIVVEEGDAYRPLSPSQLHARRDPDL